MAFEQRELRILVSGPPPARALVPLGGQPRVLAAPEDQLFVGFLKKFPASATNSSTWSRTQLRSRYSMVAFS